MYIFYSVVKNFHNIIIFYLPLTHLSSIQDKLILDQS